MEDNIKNSFQKVREDFNFLRQEMDVLRLSIIEVRGVFSDLSKIIQDLNNQNESKFRHYENELNSLKKIILGTTTDRQTDNNSFPTQKTLPSTQKPSLSPQNGQNKAISIGNVGVQTDRQTDRQTDDDRYERGIYNQKNIQKNYSNPSISTVKLEKTLQNTQIIENSPNSIDNAIEILDSLDNIKKEIRLKFKRLTDQEWLVFSTLYQLDEERGFADYKSLSNKLCLTESSIRDYIGRLIKKGIPLIKHKINNKSIQLKVSDNLKKIATISTIVQLREI